MYTLGIDIGSSSVKVSILDYAKGICVGSAHSPEEELPILAPQKGWAEQDPESWMIHMELAFRKALQRASLSASAIEAIGISYQMHGLVILSQSGSVVRPSIIWCDSRAVSIGDKAFQKLGEAYCLTHLLNSPGNFTASKLKWVLDHESHLTDQIYKVMLPGDYMAYRLTSQMQTTRSGLSEGMLWDFSLDQPAAALMDWYGIRPEWLSELVPTFGVQAGVAPGMAARLGLREGIPVAYRAGDQPNNAFSLNVLEPGEIAATAGTSGVIYGVNGQAAYDPQSRVNSFAHVNHTAANTRVGVLLCINGTGILNSWLRRMTGNLSYDEMNQLAAQAPAGSDGLLVYPFGNGAERVLGNASPGSMVKELNFNQHGRPHLLRAAQEGIANSFRYGADVMAGMGMETRVVRAGKANMFLSPVFGSTVANLLNARIELYDTDGALGAARGAALGAGFYATPHEAFASFRCLQAIEPDAHRDAVCAGYETWKEKLEF